MSRALIRVWIRPRNRRDGTLAYQVRWREVVDGAARMCSHDCPTMTEAKRLQREVQSRLGIVAEARRSTLTQDLIARPGRLDLIIPDWIEEKRLGLKPTSQYMTRTHYLVKRMIDHFKITETSDITPAFLRDVLRFYAGRQHTAAATIFAFKRLLRWAEDRYAIDRSAYGVKVLKPQNKEQILWTQEQVAAIEAELLRPMNPNLHGPVPRHSRQWRHKISETLRVLRYTAYYPVFRLEVLWAVRPKEASLILVENWDSARRRLTISAAAAKNGYARSFVVDQRTAVLLDAAAKGRRHDDVLLTTTYGLGWSQQSQNHLMRAVLKRLGIRGTLYCTRHFATTRLCEQAKGRLRLVQSITGHRSLSELAKYLHMLSGDQAKLADSDYARFLEGTGNGSATTAAEHEDRDDDEQGGDGPALPTVAQ